jgi:ATP-dependent RNA helicase HelY
VVPAAAAREAAGTRATATSPGLLPPDPVGAFEQTYGFPFDEFQRRACSALVEGSSVLVAAPTGAGKTVVGEFAAWLALQGTGKTFYTTPIKALSNQKYGDFLSLHGPSNVGLLTGDNSLNGDAPVVVMTTEVLRNMIYEDSPELRALEYVVLDEVHYLQDRYRGGVWEEILIHLPVDVKIVSLSATVSNAEEFAEWLQTLRGRTEVIIEDRRPVEIKHWYFASDELLPMFVRGRDGQAHPNPRGQEMDRRRRRGGPSRPGPGGRREREKRARVPWRSEVVERLQGDGMLPAIYFIFSRKGCDEAVRQCMREGIRLTNAVERKQITGYAESRVAELSPNELDVLGYGEWAEGLANGLAAHHAGMIPPFKETVEELFARGLIKVVFATETLALGINMPARTVVIESLMKFTGEKHELITPGQYTQLSGRAGRRGIDEIGHSVVLLQRFTPFDTITRLASTRTYPLQSSFQPSYNMAVNLVRSYDRHEAEHLVNSSFAQFQTDRDVVRLERKRERSEAYLASYRERMECDRGDFDEYMELRARLRRLEQRGGRGGRARNERVLEAIAGLRPGDVIDLPTGRRRGRYAVIEVTKRRSEAAPRVLVLSEERTMIRLAPVDFRDPPRPAARLRLARDFNVRDLSARRKLARDLAGLETAEVPLEPAEDDGEVDEVKALQRALASHPVAGCPELGRHIHFAERAARLEKEVAGVDRQVARRTGTLARRFDRVLDVLEDLSYVADWELTDKGERLTRVYNESDLLVVEMLERDVLAGLEPPELAAVCSALVYETRGPEMGNVVEMPTPRSRAVHGELMRLWKQIRRKEDERALELTREPDPGFADRAFRWAAGWPLENVLSEDDPAGDFVRSTKQLIDLLRQIEEVTADAGLREVVGRAVDGLHRGVVAYSSLEL